MSGFHIQTTEMGIPLIGIIKEEPVKKHWLLELDAPFTNLPPAQRLSAIGEAFGSNHAADAHVLRTIFKTIIHIHQHPEAAANLLKAYRKRKAALEGQLADLRQRKRQVIKEIQEENRDCPEEDKKISSIANEMGMLKQRLKELVPQCFREFLPNAAAAADYNNFEGYLEGPGQCPEHEREVLHLAHLRAERKKTLQKTFARGWKLLIRQFNQDQYITRSDLCRRLDISVAETEELISKVAWICMQDNLWCLADVVMPNDDASDKNLQGPVQLGKPPFAPPNAITPDKSWFDRLNNPFESPDERVNVIINYS